MNLRSSFFNPIHFKSGLLITYNITDVCYTILYFALFFFSM